MKTILLTQGKTARVDDSDYVLVSQVRWYAARHGFLWYAQRHSSRVDGRQRTIFLHHAIMGAIRVDHKDGDGLNCQRNNLRPASAQQNACNRRKHMTTTSRFKGVTKHSSGKWQAQIQVNKKSLYLGLFLSEHEAACVYDQAASLHFKEFAALNETEQP